MEQFRILPRVPGKLFEDAAIAVHAYHGGTLVLETAGSFFFAVISGRLTVNGYPLRAGMYGCLPRLAQFERAEPGSCRVMIAEAKGYAGMFSLGGPIEPVGRLRYINGCTDTGLIQPPRLGDPCLNALFFPAGIQQTAHRHPSHRIGAIYDGEGWCLTGPGESTPMRQGDIFIIPVQSLHWFETDASDMRIMVFHPDSEFGPTDERHQMLDATLIPA